MSAYSVIAAALAVLFLIVIYIIQRIYVDPERGKIPPAPSSGGGTPGGTVPPQLIAAVEKQLSLLSTGAKDVQSKAQNVVNSISAYAGSSPLECISSKTLYTDVTRIMSKGGGDSHVQPPSSPTSSQFSAAAANMVNSVNSIKTACDKVVNVVSTLDAKKPYAILSTTDPTLELISVFSKYSAIILSNISIVTQLYTNWMGQYSSVLQNGNNKFPNGVQIPPTNCVPTNGEKNISQQLSDLNAYVQSLSPAFQNLLKAASGVSG